jgi:hypothetical protein
MCPKSDLLQKPSHTPHHLSPDNIALLTPDTDRYFGEWPTTAILEKCNTIIMVAKSISPQNYAQMLKASLSVPRWIM